MNEKSGEEIAARLFRHYDRGLITQVELLVSLREVGAEVIHGVRHAAIPNPRPIPGPRPGGNPFSNPPR